MRILKNGKTFALDTLDRLELIRAADLCLQSGQGDPSYRIKARGIVVDAKAMNNNLYVTLTMRRVLMGFIRPVFEAEASRRTLEDNIRLLGRGQ